MPSRPHVDCKSLRYARSLSGGMAISPKGSSFRNRTSCSLIRPTSSCTVSEHLFLCIPTLRTFQAIFSPLCASAPLILSTCILHRSHRIRPAVRLSTKREHLCDSAAPPVTLRRAPCVTHEHPMCPSMTLVQLRSARCVTQHDNPQYNLAGCMKSCTHTLCGSVAPAV